MSRPFAAIGIAIGLAVTAWCGIAAPTALAKTDVCNVSFPHPREVTDNIHFGTKNIYNQDMSRDLVCSGAFGVPDGVHLSLSAKCDMIAAVYGLANPADSVIGTADCAFVNAATGGRVTVVTGPLCGFLADVFGTGVGLFAAGATGNPLVGVIVWRGVTFFGNTAVCVGLADGGAKAWGVKHETDHEVAVAHDIVRNAKCLQLTQQRLLGISRLNWSAIDCPRGFTNRDPSPFHRPTAAPSNGPAGTTAPPSVPGGASTPAGGPSGGDNPPAPALTTAETTGGVAHTWTNYTNAGGTQGPSIASNQTVQIACWVTGFRVADGNTYWYRIASTPWNGNYYVSADAFYNNGQTSGSLIGTPFVDPAVPNCSGSGSGGGGSKSDYAETTGGVAHTWTNYTNAGGTQGPSIASNQTVQIACWVTGFRVADGNTYWYRIASTPWNGNYYVSADAFYNNGQTSGSLIGTPFVDPKVSAC